jgi:predicted lipoprotein
VLRAAIFIALTLLGPTRPSVAGDLGAIGDTLRREVLTPLYSDYDRVAQTLAATAPDCAGDWRAAMRPAFVASLLAWRRLEAVGAGPAVLPETAARVFFWPDKHGTAARQLAMALKDQAPALESVAGLRGQSAGLQSLEALEQLLYGDSAASAFACRFGQAIADYQAQLAADMATDLGRDPTDGAALALAMFTGMRTTLDTVIQLDLERPLGKNLATARGERARAWRGDLSLPLIGAALDTVERVYAAPGSFSTAILASAELAALDAILRGHLQAARQELAAIQQPLQLAVSDAAVRPEVERLVDELRAVRRLLVEQLGPALGLSSGFNALDGD